MNYKRISAAFFIAGLIAMFGFVRADDDPIAKIVAQLNKWLSANRQEKVYLQMDKPYYSAGDDIWFKAYVVTASEHRLSAISGVLNIDLIDDRDSIKQSVKLPIVNGLTWGDFALPDTLTEGNYRIRAYTNWMRNAGDDYFFDKTIAIVNAITNNVSARARFAYGTLNGKQQINAAIDYTGPEGKLYKGNRVTYDVRLGTKSITKGSGITGDNGNLNISFLNSNPELLRSGRIVTTLRLADKSTVTKSFLIKAGTNNVDVQFFPEGGNLVYGNTSKIAFKAVGADGLGAAIKGAVVDDKNNVITTFSTTHAGMGVFELRPEAGAAYKAKITYANGSETSVALPSVTAAGYLLKINQFEDNIIVKILPGPDVTQSAEAGVISLIAQSGGIVYYAGKSKPGSKSLTATIPKNKFPSGIVQFTLFSPSGEPMNERLVFVRNNDELKLGINTDKQIYSPRGQVKMELNAKDANDKPIVGSFSVAITDETKVPPDQTREQTIFSNLLLTSDLKGYIEKPGYYFAGNDEKTSADLDVLMLTQGYRRFDWKPVMAGTTPAAVYQPEKTITISGRIKTLGGKPVPHGKVTLLSNTGGVFMTDTVADESGRFSFPNLVFTDSVKFVVQARTAKDRKNVQIDLDNVAPQKVAKNKNYPDLQTNIGDGLSSFAENSKAKYEQLLKYGLTGKPAKMLKEVQINAKRNPAEHSSNLNGPGNADQVIGVEEFEKMGCFRISDCLQGRLVGVVFRNGTPYLMRNLRYPMQIIVDGITIDDPSILDNFNPADIESVEVLKSIGYTSIYGMRGGGGVLLITTKRGGPNYNYTHYAPGIIVYNPKGYYKSRVFYAPRYDNPKTNTAIPDLRSTIYWNPNIITNNEGNASFDFFNADGKGTYRVVVEGIDSDGNLGRRVYRYKVE